MSKFYVGQRVRIKWSNDFPFLDGREGVIAQHFIARSKGTGADQHMSGPGEYYAVTPDGYPQVMPCGRSPSGLARFMPSSDQLEPLQPERNQTIAWSECVWKPEHMRAEA